MSEKTKQIYDSIHFLHDVVIYVPCYQVNDDGYPHFRYSLSDGTADQQMAYSMKPDYILVLKGKWDAKTQPFSGEIKEYNLTLKEEENE